MPYAQLIIGPPGSGKSTYCYGMNEFLQALKRQCVIINFDPQNDNIKYECCINIMDLITVRDVMEEFNLGPNGSLMYCFEFLELNFEWLVDKLREKFPDDSSIHDSYFLFDFPGQVELYMHNKSCKTIINLLEKKFNFRFCVVNLIDSYHCLDPSRFLSASMLSLFMMIHLELPHVNVLSKFDLLNIDELPFSPDFYSSLSGDLRYLLNYDVKSGSSESEMKRKKLSESIIELLEDFGLVSFYWLKVEDKEQMFDLLSAIDKANGYIFGGLSESNYSITETAMKAKIHNDP